MKIRVVIMEVSGVEGYNMPINMPIKPYSDRAGRHIQEVVKEFERYCADSIELFILPYTNSGMRWVRDNDVHIVSMSALDWFHMIDKEIEIENEIKANGTLLICGAGNDGNKDVHVEGGASQRNWLSVGAIGKNLQPKYFTSWGDWKVDTVAVTGLHGFDGTSDACPIVAGKVTHYYEQHYKALGYFPSRMQSHQWVKLNSHDVWDEGQDVKTGHGLLKLPKRWEFEDVVLDIDSPEVRYVRTVIDGVVQPLVEIDNLIAGFVTSGRLMLGVRDIANSLNSTTHYDKDTNTAFFSVVR